MYVFVSLYLCTDTDDFEELNVVPYSNPPELPDVMKQSDTSVANPAEQPVP